MIITVVIPTERYDALLKDCDPSRPEYPLLRNGIITQNAHGKVVHILCELEQAEKLLDLARQSSPEAVPSILEGIDRRRGV